MSRTNRSVTDKLTFTLTAIRVMNILFPAASLLDRQSGAYPADRGAPVTPACFNPMPRIGHAYQINK